VVVGIGAERALQQVERGDSVDDGVVHLGVDGEASVVESFDEMHLPQRPVPVEQAAVQPGGELEKLAHPSRGGQRGAPHVVVQIDVFVQGPRHVGDSAQDGRGALAEGRAELLAGAHGLVGFPDELRAGVRRRGEQLQPGHVKGMLTGLGEQHGRVEGRDELHRGFLVGSALG